MIRTHDEIREERPRLAIVPLHQTAPETGLSAIESAEHAPGVDGSREGNTNGSAGHTGGDA